MSSGRVIVIGGGARSGKSRFALERTLELAGAASRRVFVATAEAFDDEMRARIQAHQEERLDANGQSRFETLEEPRALPELIERLGDGEFALGPGDVVLVDCLTLWLSNVLLESEAPRRELEERAAKAAQALRGAADAAVFDLVFVTNEVGMGLVPPSELGRVFRDCAGRLHQELGSLADELYFAALGRMMRLVPGPVEVMR